MEIEYKNDLYKIKTNISSPNIPIEFIYTQLPVQSEPQTIWPSFQWSDISTNLLARKMDNFLEY